MLPLAEHWYSSSYHPSINITPFEAPYGRSPPNIRLYLKVETVLRNSTISGSTFGHCFYWNVVALATTQMLGSRKVHSSKGDILQFLVHLEGLTTFEDTWEIWLDLLKAYPEGNLEDRLKTDGVGNDAEVQIENGPEDGSSLNQEGMNKSLRPQRQKRAPVWSRDYVGIP